MKFSDFNTSWQSTIASNRILVMANIGLTVCLGMAMVSISKDKERVVITPPHLAEQVVVAWNDASPEYYKSVAHWLAGTIGSVNENNIEFVKKALEQYFNPDIRQDLLAKLQGIAKDPVRKIAGAQVWFEGKELVWERETSKVFVLGNLAYMSPGQNQASYDPVTYEFDIKMIDGLPRVTGFNSYRGAARTQRWLRENEFLGIGKEKVQKEIEEESARQIEEGEL